MMKGVVLQLPETSFPGEGPNQVEWVEKRDISIDPSPLQDFCAKPLNELEQGLVLVAAVVAFADRRFLRRRGSGWKRGLQITLPVSCPELWQRAPIDEALRDALRYSSGDQWDFNYVGGFEPIVSSQSSFDFSNQCDVVLPFSQGLDSYLTWRELATGRASGGSLRVHSRSSSSPSRDSREYWNRCLDSEVSLSIPIKLSVGTHPEPSYRTRPFLFYVMAALAAVKLGLSEVVIGENGASSLGPALLPIGDEHPNRGTFPAFTQKVSRFINQLLGTHIQFKHPNLFRTKGQMFQRVLRTEVGGWRNTNSCVRDSRSKLGAPHCGLCCGCLQRRTALRKVGLQDSEYTWTKPDMSTLGKCTPNRLERNVSPNDEDIAMYAIYSMESLAQLAKDSRVDDLRLRSVALELANIGVQDFESCLRSIADLCREHYDEWDAFKAQFPPNSLVRCYELHSCIN